MVFLAAFWCLQAVREMEVSSTFPKRNVDACDVQSRSNLLVCLSSRATFYTTMINNDWCASRSLGGADFGEYLACYSV